MAPTVLVVEDEVLISHMLEAALVDEGFEVRVVESADAALRQLGEGHIDVLLTDINLAGPVDGVELAKEARRLLPELPVVYASGSLVSSDIWPLVPRSVFVNKPYDVRSIGALLRRLAPQTH